MRWRYCLRISYLSFRTRRCRLVSVAPLSEPSVFTTRVFLLVAYFLYFQVFLHPGPSPVCRCTVFPNRSFLSYGNLSSTRFLLIIIFCISLYMDYSLFSLVNFKRNLFFDLKRNFSLRAMLVLSSYFTRSISLATFLRIKVVTVLLLLENIQFRYWCSFFFFVASP